MDREDAEGPLQDARLCSSECGARLESFVHYAESHAVHFYVSILLAPAIGAVVAIWRENIDNGALGYLIMGVGMGAAMIKYPFTTPQTVQLFGMRSSIRLARGLGGLLVLAGVALFFICDRWSEA